MSEREIIICLMNNNYTSKELADDLDLTKGRVNANLKGLRHKGLVKMLYQPPYKVPVYAITPEGVNQIKLGVWK